MERENFIYVNGTRTVEGRTEKVQTWISISAIDVVQVVAREDESQAELLLRAGDRIDITGLDVEGMMRELGWKPGEGTDA